MPNPNLSAALARIRTAASEGVARIDAAAAAIDGDMTKAAEIARRDLAVAVHHAHVALGAEHAEAVQGAALSARLLVDAATRRKPRPTTDRVGTRINAATIASALREMDATLSVSWGIADTRLRDAVVEGIQGRVGERGCTLDEAVFAWVSESRRERQKTPSERLTESKGYGESFSDRASRVHADVEREAAEFEAQRRGDS